LNSGLGTTEINIYEKNITVKKSEILGAWNLSE